MQCHPSQQYVMYAGWNTFICSVVQCLHALCFLFFFTNFFSNATDNEHCQLVEILIERSVFGFNIQKKVF